MPRTSLTAPPQPLEANEVQRAIAAGDRLRAELSTLLSKVPRARNSALSLARELGVDRNLTQKVVSATAAGIEGVEALARLPGPDALRVFVAAASEASGLGHPDAGAVTAVDEFEGLIRDLAGSQTRLIQRIRAHSSEAVVVADADRDAEIRRRLFHDVADLLGMSVDLIPFIGLVRPRPDQPVKIHGINGYALLGMAWDGGPLPIGSSRMALDDDPGELVEEVELPPLEGELADQNGLVPRFCSEPPARVTRRGIRGLDILTIDPATRAGAHPNSRANLAFAGRWGDDSNPMYRERNDHRFWSQFVTIRRPTRRLILDVYVHKTLAKASVPHAAAYRWRPGLSADPLRHWDERLPGRVRIEMLGTGLDHAASPAWARHAEFAEYLFEQSGWPAEEFIGYRCDVPYPIWNAGYYLTFDFRLEGHGV